jgi:hypothetical protein
MLSYPMPEYTSLSAFYKHMTGKHSLTLNAIYLDFADHPGSSYKNRNVSEMGSVSVFRWRLLLYWAPR